MAKKRICSNDMAAVPDTAFVLHDGEGEMYFCNPRCLCLWSVNLATRANIPDKLKDAAYLLTLPEGTSRRFSGIVSLGQWATANAIGSEQAEWLKNGESVLRD
jgi:hypothetical protein